jgi:hypothetical protein
VPRRVRLRTQRPSVLVVPGHQRVHQSGRARRRERGESGKEVLQRTQRRRRVARDARLRALFDRAFATVSGGRGTFYFISRARFIHAQTLGTRRGWVRGEPPRKSKRGARGDVRARSRCARCSGLASVAHARGAVAVASSTETAKIVTLSSARTRDRHRGSTETRGQCGSRTALRMDTTLLV